MLRSILDTRYWQRIQPTPLLGVAYAGTTNGLKRATPITYERPWVNIHIQNKGHYAKTQPEENDECCQDCGLQTSPTWGGLSARRYAFKADKTGTIFKLEIGARAFEIPRSRRDQHVDLVSAQRAGRCTRR